MNESRWFLVTNRSGGGVESADECRSLQAALDLKHGRDKADNASRDWPRPSRHQIIEVAAEGMIIHE